MYKKILQLLSMLMLITNLTNAQQGGPDCSSAVTICSSSSIAINPSGIGFDDFSFPGNNAGCLSTDEQASTWFYFEFNDMTPAGSPFTFQINPDTPVDYDFALFGPNPFNCESLGSPIRCSYASQPGSTGLSTAANDVSEGVGGDRVVMEIFVNAGDGFFLLVDNFSQSNVGANISFGEAGANFLDCNASPFCGLMADANAVTEVCQGSNSFVLNTNVFGETGSPSYNWGGSSIGFLSDPTSPFPTVNLPPDFVGTLTYNVTVMDAACEVVTNDVTIQVLPLPQVQIFDPNILCSTGDPVTLNTNQGAGTGIWGGAAGPGGIIDPTILGPGPHTVTFQFTDVNGCTNNTSNVININESPTAQVTGDFSLCQVEIDQQSAVINGFGIGGTPDYLYEWNTPLGIDNNQNVTVLFPGPYSLTVTDALGCTGEALPVVVDVTPDPEIVIFNPGVICGSSNMFEIFVATFDPGVGQWDTSTGVINSIGFIDPSALGVGFHDVTYIFMDSFTGCENSETLTFEISPPPAAIPTTNGSQCNADDIALFGDSNVNGVSYSWTGPNGFMSNEQNPATANGPGTYTLTTTIAGCESIPVELVVDLGNSPVAVATNDGPVCFGDLVSLGGSVDLTGTTTYAWTGPNGYSSSDQNPTDATETGDYTLIVTVDGCESDMVTTTVTINAAPIATASNDGPVCIGSTVMLSGGVDVSGTTTYAWTGPNGYSSSDQNPADATETGDYNLVVTVDGCESDMVTTTVTINATPIATASNDGPVCIGSTVMLSGGVDVSGTTTYAWTGPNGYSSSDQNPTDATETGDYDLIVTVDGCESDMVTTTVTINATPIATALNDGPACAGSTVMLSGGVDVSGTCLLYTSPSPRDATLSRMPSSA